jgi:hypothetical protein
LTNKSFLSTETQEVTIVNMVNPNYSDAFTGFKIEIMDGGTSMVRETFTLANTITISPGVPLVSF